MRWWKELEGLIVVVAEIDTIVTVTVMVRKRMYRARRWSSPMVIGVAAALRWKWMLGR